MNVLIIEDEIKTAKELKKLIEGIDDGIRVLTILSSVKSAIQWFKEHPAPDLIFSDIQLADGLSFDIYQEAAVKVPVIFCTAFDEYAIRAFEANGIDYLLKPIDEDKLHQSLEKYMNFKKLFIVQPDDYNLKLSSLASQLDHSFKRSILIHFRDQIIPVKTAGIRFVYTANGLVMLTDEHDHLYTTQYTMEQMEAMLDPSQFFRANRQFIINREFIQNIEHYFNRRLVVKAKGETPEKIIIGKVKYSDFLKWMEF
ncbi:LytTR family DNA-binding domain-containing protein [Pedobacter sp. L105]|uniref:LytR/AlgR family response regulator transcription factor n=1 Tax=Pedobacter sp. L105 TaxID=1641871 RepID=UPI00131C84D0|nr:LytTR family DNA-binding domain-containing protein [Pedobacter sp. L105]